MAEELKLMQKVYDMMEYAYPALAQYLTLGGAAFLLTYGLFALRRMWLAPDAAMEAGERRAAPRKMMSVLAALGLGMAFTLNRRLPPA